MSPGKVALVTGGASGIGAACAERLRALGFELVLADLPAAEPQAAADRVQGLGIGCDVSDPGSVSDLFAQVAQTFGRLDVAINNAGVGVPNKRPVGEMSDEDWHRVMSVNSDGVFYSMRAELPLMLACGGGSIVNVASVMASVGTPGGSAYAASKHAVLGLTRAAALEYAASGIRVNAVGPGFVDTPLLAHQPPEVRRRTELAHPVGRLGTTDEIAAVVSFLASDDASFVTGAFWLADGGYTAL